MTSTEIKHLYSKDLLNEYARYAPTILDRLFSGTVDRRLSSIPSLDSSDITAEQARDLLLSNDCVLISACRAVHEETKAADEKRNEDNTSQLEQELKDMNLQYIIVDGCYREKFEDEASHEKSFFVFENPARGTDLFQRMYERSEYYHQDSFLHIAAGMTWRAFEIFTNDDTRQEGANFRLCGKLKLNLPPVGPYTVFKHGVMKFVMDDEEELKDTTVPTLVVSQPKIKKKVIRKRFVSPSSSAITLGSDGNVKIGRYTIGTWKKVESRKNCYEVSLNNKKQMTSERKVELYELIATACRKGVTGFQIIILS